MDTSKPGRVMAQVMQELDERYVGKEDDVEIGTVIVIVEVHAKDIDQYHSEELEGTDDFASRIHLRSNDGRHWVQMGLLDYAKEGLRGYPDIDEEDDEDDE